MRNLWLCRLGNFTVLIKNNVQKSLWSTGSYYPQKSAGSFFLLSTVRMLTQKDGLAMPEVGIYNSPDPNAFATGASKDAALVAVLHRLI